MTTTQQAPRTTTIDGHLVHLGPDGFLLDHEEWDAGVAAALAGELGIHLGPEHRTVLAFVRADYTECGASPTLWRVTAGTEIPVRRLQELFPGDTVDRIAYVAGLPGPAGRSPHEPSRP